MSQSNANRKAMVAEKGFKMLRLATLKSAHLEDSDKLVWNSAYKVIKISPNELLVSHGLRSSFTYTVSDPKELNLLDKVADIFQEPHTLTEALSALSQEHAAYLRESLLPLLEERILVKESDSSLQHYQVHYREMPDLSASTIGLIGAGPFGLRVATSLLDLGIRHLIVADDRRFFNREQEIPYFPFPMRDGLVINGKHYSEALYEYLNSFEISQRGVDVHTYTVLDEEHISHMFRSSAMVLIAMEMFHPRLFTELNLLAIRERRPLFLNFIDGSLAFVGPIVVPGDTACYTCLEGLMESNIIAQSSFLSMKSFLEVEQSVRNGRWLGGQVPLYDVATGFLVDGLVRFLAQTSSTPYLNRMLCIDFEAMELNIEDILKNPGCPACSDLEVPQMAPIIL